MTLTNLTPARLEKADFPLLGCKQLRQGISVEMARQVYRDNGLDEVYLRDRKTGSTYVAFTQTDLIQLKVNQMPKGQAAKPLNLVLSNGETRQVEPLPSAWTDNERNTFMEGVRIGSVSGAAGLVFSNIMHTPIGKVHLGGNRFSLGWVDDMLGPTLSQLKGADVLIVLGSSLASANTSRSVINSVAPHVPGGYWVAIPLGIATGIGTGAAVGGGIGTMVQTFPSNFWDRDQAIAKPLLENAPKSFGPVSQWEQENQGLRLVKRHQLFQKVFNK